MDSKRKVYKKETLAVFRRDENKRGKITRSSSPTPKSQTINDGEISPQGRPPREETSIRQKGPGWELAPLHREICGILPCARNTKHKQAASSVKHVRLYMEKQNASRISGLSQEPKTIWLCISGYCATGKYIYIAVGPKFFEIQAACSVH